MGVNRMQIGDIPQYRTLSKNCVFTDLYRCNECIISLKKVIESTVLAGELTKASMFSSLD